MKLTLDMFKLLCGFYQVNPRFIGLTDGMGYKLGPDDEHFMGCYTHLSTGQDETKATEIVAFGIFFNRE